MQNYHNNRKRKIKKMTKSNKSTKNQRMKQLLHELIKDSHRSDHQLAKVTSMSQPTVTRLRSQLEKEGYIREYTVIPDVTKMNYQIMAIFCIKYKAHLKDKVKNMTNDAALKHPSTVFASRAQGMGKNAISISLFKNYAEYAKYVETLAGRWDNIVEEWSSMLVDLNGPILKPFSLKYLVEKQTK